jgi:hypothetical protein
VSEFNPEEGEYYSEHVLPRVLPWAASIAALAALLLLLFLTWRLTLYSLRCCRCYCAGEGERERGRCHPTGSPSAVLRSRDVALLRLLITFGLLGTVGVCIWGFTVVGPQTVHRFWGYVAQWTVRPCASSIRIHLHN